MGKKVDIARVQGTDEQRRRVWAAAGQAGRKVGPWLLGLALSAAAAQERAAQAQDEAK